MLEYPKRIHRYFSQDIWKVRARELPFPKSLLLKALKIILLSARGYREDRSDIRASALTLYTLLSIVPVTALFFGISKGFGLEARLETWLLTQFPEQQDMMRQVVIFARRTLDGAKGGLVAGAGVAFLMYSVLKVIGNIETAFNDIWAIAKPRSWGRKFSDYLSLTLVGPFLVLGASSLNVYLATLVGRAAEAAPLSALFSPLVRTVLGIGPVLMLWLLFSFLYSFLPNIKVRLVSAVIGGAVAAILYQAVQSLYISVQVGVSKANAIYGSFAALPLFLIWLQTSWHIVLIGAEVTHNHQNFDGNELEERLPQLSFRAFKRLALRVYSHVGRRFVEGKPPQSLERLGEELGIPSRVLADVVKRLNAAGILSEVALPEPDDPAYQPARDPNRTRPSDVMEALEREGEELAGAQDPGSERIETLLGEFDRSIRENPADRPFSESGPAPEAPGRTG